MNVGLWTNPHIGTQRSSFIDCDLSKIYFFASILHSIRGTGVLMQNVSFARLNVLLKNTFFDGVLKQNSLILGNCGNAILL